MGATYVAKDPNEIDTQSSEIYGIPLLNFDAVLEKMAHFGVELQKFIEDEEKKKIPTLYDYYNEVANQYLDRVDTAEKVHFQAEDVVTRAVMKDSIFKEDVKNLVAHVYSIKELDKELLMGYAVGKLVIMSLDEKGKALFHAKPGYIRLDHLRKFLRMVAMQMKNQERPVFLWGLKPSKPETRDMEEIEENPYLLEKGQVEAPIDAENVENEVEEEPARRRNTRIVME